MDQDGTLHIGTIVGVHGIKGYLKLHSSAESTDLFEPGKLLSLHHCGGERKTYTVRDIKPYTKGLLIAFEGIEDRNKAAEFIGAEIFIQRSELPALEEESWYWCDLIGLDVYQTDNSYVGRIEKIFSNGAHDVFVVKRKKKETLIPAIQSVVRNINLIEKKMTVDLPEGL